MSPRAIATLALVVAAACQAPSRDDGAPYPPSNREETVDLAPPPSPRPDLAEPRSEPRRVFVTSTRYVAGSLNKVCQGSAAPSIAWLSSRWSTGDGAAIDAIQSNGPWVRLDGEVAFANAGQLATQPSVPLTITEKGTALPPNELVWTGTRTSGNPASSTCENWTTSSSSFWGTVGRADSIDGWTDAGTQTCNYGFHVYCFEQ
jgi:hypothetical protein